MKKLNIFASTLALLAALVGFTGCPSVHADQEALIDLSSYYVRGSCGSWDANSDSDNLLTTNDDGTYEYTFLAAAESVNFAIDDGNWTVTYRKDSSGNLLTWALDEEILAYAGNDADCPELSGLTIGTYYTVTITPYSDRISVKITEGESTAKKFYILAEDAIESLTYNGKNYTYSFTSSSATESLVIYSGDTFYYGTAALTATDVALTATTSRLDSDEKENVVTLTGLTANTNYVATFSYNSTKKVLSVAKIEKDVYKWEGHVLKGGWEGWWQDTETLTSDTTITFTTASTKDHDASGKEWGIFPPDESNEWYVENLVLGTRTEMTYVSDNSSRKNSTMAVDWDNSATYTIKLELTDNNCNATKAYVTITKN